MIPKQTEEVSKDTALRMAIGDLVLQKMVSGNDVPVSRCTITTTEIQACKEALENLEKDPPISRKKLAETKEPVAFLSADTKAVITRAMRSIRAEDEMDGKVIKDFPTPLYITPPSREWVRLSEAEIAELTAKLDKAREAFGEIVLGKVFDQDIKDFCQTTLEELDK